MSKAINFKRDITRPLLLTIFVLSVSIGWLFMTSYDLLLTQIKISKIDDYRFKLATLQRFIIDAETGQRGYLITNNPTFLDAYKSKPEEVRKILNYLDKSQLYFADNSSKILQLRTLSATKFRIIDSSIQVQLHSGAYASHLTLSKDKGKLVMDKIETIIVEMDKNLEITKKGVSLNARHTFTKVIIGSILLIIIISGILLFSYRRTVRIFEQLIENKVQSEKLGFEAEHDPLTRLANRRGLDKHLRNIHSISDRSEDMYAVFYMDLDGFKLINDKMGHEMGDAVLIKTAELFKSELRETDFISRVGGDEFVLVIHGYSKDAELCLLAERLLQSIRQPIEIMQKKYKIGVSIGIARFPFNSKHLNTILQLADKAMYESKKAGKNQYKLA